MWIRLIPGIDKEEGEKGNRWASHSGPLVMQVIKGPEYPLETPLLQI